jgi:hypothetical protein
VLNFITGQRNGLRVYVMEMYVSSSIEGMFLSHIPAVGF